MRTPYKTIPLKTTTATTTRLRVEFFHVELSKFLYEGPARHFIYGGVNPGIVKNIKRSNFLIITVMYIKVYISGVEMSQSIHFDIKFYKKLVFCLCFVLFRFCFCFVLFFCLEKMAKNQFFGIFGSKVSKILPKLKKKTVPKVVSEYDFQAILAFLTQNYIFLARHKNFWPKKWFWPLKTNK